MVLLDLEGIDVVLGEGIDDYCIFILIILLVLMLIYNFVGVLIRIDLDGFEYF